jgi:hypothetical protein
MIFRCINDFWWSFDEVGRVCFHRSHYDKLHDEAVSYKYKTWIVAKIEAIESGMTCEDRSSASAPAGQSVPKPSVQKAKRPVQGPTQPDWEPPEHIAKQAKRGDQTVVIDDESEQWMQAKIAEAAADAGEGGGAEAASEANASENKLAFEPSWRVALQKYCVDDDAQLQLALLRDQNWHAAAEIVWKLTKKGAYDNDLKNPSGFVNRCCTTALKAMQW